MLQDTVHISVEQGCFTEEYMDSHCDKLWSQDDVSR